MVSIVIPNFNGQKLLQKNLPQVLKAAEKYEAEIIVADDYSTDKSCEFLRQNYPQIIEVTTPKQSGFATTCNLGVKKAQGEIIILLNTDVVPETNFLEYLLPYFKDPEVFSVACMEKSPEDGKTVFRGRGIGRWRRGFLVHSAGAMDKSYTLWASGGASAFSRKKWQELGGFDEIYNPFYWEDIDLSYRAWQRGWKVIFERQSVVRHEHSQGTINSFYSREKIRKIAYRNQIFFVWKNINDPGMLLSHLFWLPYHFLKAVLSSDSAFIEGFLLSFPRIPHILFNRLQTFGFQKITDGKIFRLNRQ